MQGTVLRTNYKRTGGVLDITAIGGGYAIASAQNGAGTDIPYGGFVYVTSYSLAISQANLTANIMGDSTHGIMSFFYGSDKFPNGYKFLPLGFRMRSGAVPVSDGASGFASMPIAWEPTFSSSIWMLYAFGFIDSYLISLGGASFLMDVWGFIVSSP